MLAYAAIAAFLESLSFVSNQHRTEHILDENQLPKEGMEGEKKKKLEYNSAANEICQNMQ